MNRKISVFFLITLFVSSINLISCKKEEVCTISTVDYVGNYTIDEDCSLSPAGSYSITISTNASDSTIVIEHFWKFFQHQVYASVDCDKITIARQEPDSDGFFVEGSGNYSVSNGITTLTFNYTVYDETDPNLILPDICSNSVFIKQ